MKKIALIVAGGNGSRMGSEIPKQFLELGGKPVLIHTLTRFIESVDGIEIYLVLPESQIELWKDLVARCHFNYPQVIVAGGDTRQESVRRGLKAIPDKEALVAIHDGVRPLVSGKIISASFNSAQTNGTGCVSVPVTDSARVLSGDSWIAIPRADVRLMQTPQTFRLSLIRDAYSRVSDPDLTDDASLAERAGHKISFVEGDPVNLKITLPIDIKIAESLIEAGN